jgi:hypothetical protein
MTLAQRVSNFLVATINLERRRSVFPSGVQPALPAPAHQRGPAVDRRGRGDDRAGLGVETPLENEAEITAAIVEAMSAFTHRVYDHALPAERAGNSKTCGVVRGEFVVSADIPERLRHGLFAESARYPAWVRFAGPGPLAPADLRTTGW